MYSKINYVCILKSSSQVFKGTCFSAYSERCVIKIFWIYGITSQKPKILHGFPN